MGSSATWHRQNMHCSLSTKASIIERRGIWKLSSPSLFSTLLISMALFVYVFESHYAYLSLQSLQIWTPLDCITNVTDSIRRILPRWLKLKSVEYYRCITSSLSSKNSQLHINVYFGAFLKIAKKLAFNQVESSAESHTFDYFECKRRLCRYLSMTNRNDKIMHV